MVSVTGGLVIYLMWVAYGESIAKMKSETTRKRKLEDSFSKIWKNKTKCRTVQKNTNRNASYNQEIGEIEGEVYDRTFR